MGNQVPNPVHTDRLAQAFTFASVARVNRARKGTTIPYVSHAIGEIAEHTGCATYGAGGEGGARNEPCPNGTTKAPMGTRSRCGAIYRLQPTTSNREDYERSSDEK